MQLARNDMLDGKIFRLEPWDVVHARSMLGDGGPGPDEVPPTVWRQIPYVLVLRIHEMFEEYTRLDSNTRSSEFWKLIRYIGIPKERKVTELFEQLRWIGLTSVLQRWMLISIRPQTRSQLSPSIVHTYGFKPSRSTSDLQGVLRECIHNATVWGIPLYIASQDVRFAFDSMDHGFMLTAHQRRGLHNQLLALMARELRDVEATM